MRAPFHSRASARSARFARSARCSAPVDAPPPERAPTPAASRPGARPTRLSLLALALALAGCGASHQGMDVERTPAYEADRSADAREESAPGGAPAPSSTASSIPHAPMAQAVAAEEPAGGDGEPAPGPQSWRRATNAARFATVSLGGGHSLELRRVRVSVHVEGLRARTVVDHVFYNPHARTIEGTFRYPLPPEASVSSYAMYLGTGRAEPDFFGPNTQLPPGARVEQIQAQIDPQAWGELRVGRIVKAERGREVYEDTTRRAVDPALVEEVAPNTFEARVFPIQAQGFHRVIVSYEQTLPRLGDALEYAFPLPEEGELEAFDFQLEADASLAARARYTGDVTGVEPQQARGAHAFHYRHEGAVQGGALAFRFAAPSGPLEVLAGAHPERDEAHALFRVRGDARLPSQGAYAEDAVFLLDTSLSEHPERFQIDVALLEAILARSPGIRRFNVITFDAGARWLRGRWIDNDEDGRAEAIEALEAILLEGATDLGAALEALATPPMELGARVDAFLLSDGALSWGERDAGTLVRRYARRAGAPTRFFAYRTGLGAENADLLRRLTAGGGAVFNCLSVDSVPGCATAHHAPGFRVERVSVIGEASVEELLVAGGAATLTRGGELLLAGALTRPGRGTLRLEGTVAGAPRTLDYPVELTPRGELASRAWAEIAVAHLVASGDPELEELTVALSQHYRVPSRLTSFLVLETDAEYEQHDLAAARAERDAPIPALLREAAQRVTPRTAWARLMRAMREATGHHRLDPGVARRLAEIASQAPVDFVRGRVSVPAVRASDVGRRYRRERPRDPEAVDTYREEGERRREDGELGAAIRALSSAVENAPGSAEIARMVGYTLQSWGARAEAAEVFFGVLERRPYEPQSYRDLAGVLWTERPSLTALLYEAVLAGEWDGRFRGVETVVREEYALFARAWRNRAPRSPLAAYLGEREQALGLQVPEGDLRVTMTWNTDGTDIDLWVTDPEGEECYYGHRELSSGGRLLDDVTRGFGPERFQVMEALAGEYRVVAKYYGNNGNRLVARTFVTLTVSTHVGSPQQQVRRYVVALSGRGDEAEVARVRLR